MRLNIFPIFIIMALIAGCATTTSGPTSIGGNQFLLSREEGFMPSGSEPLLEEAIAEADRFCDGLEGDLAVVETKENSGPYIFGNYPKATVIFRCDD
jgi:hypothetical protein